MAGEYQFHMKRDPTPRPLITSTCDSPHSQQTGNSANSSMPLYSGRGELCFRASLILIISVPQSFSAPREKPALLTRKLIGVIFAASLS
jgi:hypothetical protein